MAARAERCFPVRVREIAEGIADGTLALLFPHFATGLACDESVATGEIASLARHLDEAADALCQAGSDTPETLRDDFLEGLPALRRSLLLDARATLDGDPAAKSVDEVILAYPGFLAIALHRVAHLLNELGAPLLPRLIAAVAQARTGVDIHPGATIGTGFMIDHGVGVVVGETAVIGNGVKLYQGVTLGALSVTKALANRKRHPTIQDHVVIYANATVLGGETVIGHDTVVGANAWVIESVPPFSIVGRNADHRPRKSLADGEIEFFI